MRSDEEQLRHMERLEEKGQLSKEQKQRMEVLRKQVSEEGGQTSAPRYVKEEDDYVEHTRGYTPLRKSELYASPFQKIKRRITEAFIEPEPLYEQRKQREYEEKQAYGRAYHEARLKAVRAEARKKALNKSHVGGLGSGFIAASLNEIGGMTTGAREFTFGPGPRPTRHHRSRKRQGRRSHDSGYDYMPDRDLSDFAF